MLDTKREIADALARVMSDAFTHGLTTDDIGEIAKMVAAQQPLALDYSAQQVAETPIGADDLPIYTELPEGLIDLPTAARKYGYPLQTIYMWVHRGRLECRGRLRAPSRGGGYIVVCEQELQNRMASPPNKGGRPKKKPAKTR